MNNLSKRLEKKGLKLSLNMSQFGESKWIVAGRNNTVCFKNLKDIKQYYF